MSAPSSLTSSPKAAKACAITQPALSMQIQELEAELGVALVERRPGEATLTDVGIEVARRAERVGEVPLGRLATVDDVAAAYVYLASDEAKFVNGVSFPVDGGMTAS